MWCTRNRNRNDMSLTDAEKDWFHRARARLNENNQLDGLAQESTFQALAKAESSLAGASPELRPGAEAQAALAIAFTHFVSGSAAAVAAQVAEHMESCKREREKLSQIVKPGSFFDESKKSLLSAPMALSVFLSVCVVTFKDKIFNLIFGS
jgi:hypothetical protein